MFEPKRTSIMFVDSAYNNVQVACVSIFQENNYGPDILPAP